MTEPKKIMQVPIDKIRVDSDPDDDNAYQREMEEARAQRIADDYDPAAYTLPELSLRGDGWYYAMAGQHRIRARAILAERGVGGMSMTMASVHFDLTRAREAELFEWFQERQKPLSQFNLYKARRARKDPATLEIDRDVKANGFRVVHGAHNGAEISAIAKLRLMQKRGNLHETLFYLQAWQAEPVPIRGELLDGLSIYLARGLTKNSDGVDPERLVDIMLAPLAMNGLNEEGLLLAVRGGGGGGRTRGNFYAEAFETRYNDGLPLGLRVTMGLDDGG